MYLELSLPMKIYSYNSAALLIYIAGLNLINQLYLLIFLFQRPSIIAIVFFIACGLFLFTFKSTQFHMEGFLMVLSASFFGGLRWTLAQVVVQKDELGNILIYTNNILYRSILIWIYLRFCLFSNIYIDINVLITEFSYIWIIIPLRITMVWVSNFFI